MIFYNVIFLNGLSLGWVLFIWTFISFDLPYKSNCWKIICLISSASINTRIIVVFPDLISCHGEGQQSWGLKMKPNSCKLNILFQYDKQKSCNAVCLFHLIYCHWVQKQHMLSRSNYLAQLLIYNTAKYILSNEMTLNEIMKHKH